MEQQQNLAVLSPQQQLASLVDLHHKRSELQKEIDEHKSEIKTLKGLIDDFDASIAKAYADIETGQLTVGVSHE